MNNQILIALKKNLDELAVEYGEVEVVAQRNVLKEKLQFYVLNFIFHHPKYKNWTMYGGSALRICYNLDRMSVDLDFEVEHSMSEDFLNKVKEEIEIHFKNTYNTGSELLTIKKQGIRSLLLIFHIGDKLNINLASKQVHVKIDLHHFIAPKSIVTEFISKKQDQLSFDIKAYNLSALMASKIAAILSRQERIIYDKSYSYKGRDIYDLLWYMDKKVIPNLDYLKAKDITVKDYDELFNLITNKILNYEKMDELIEEDLQYLFENQAQIQIWLKSWRQDYLNFLDRYNINKITTLDSIVIFEDMMADNFSFVYKYNTVEGKSFRIIYKISDYWIDLGDLPIDINSEIINKIKLDSNGINTRLAPKDILFKYASLFYKKNEEYFKKKNNVIIGDHIETKFIRMTADNLDFKRHILLNKKALISNTLDDLLK